jgi:hypothetical protein
MEKIIIISWHFLLLFFFSGQEIAMNESQKIEGHFDQSFFSLRMKYSPLDAQDYRK